jgi:hypothetical protein
LGQLKSFEVEAVKDTYSLETQQVDSEMYEYVRTALSRSKVLKAGSPGDGVLHLSCLGFGCNKIVASVTEGSKGPEVWRSIINAYWFYDTPKNPKGLSQQIIGHLAKDYASVQRGGREENVNHHPSPINPLEPLPINATPSSSGND